MRRVGRPFGLTGLLRHGCPILLARFWREGGHYFVTNVIPTLSPKEGDKGGAPAPGQLSEKQLSVASCQ
jgi:hypothetical protein